MTKVYVLEHQTYYTKDQTYENLLVGVFSTKDKAVDWIKVNGETYNNNPEDQYIIGEEIIDEVILYTSCCKWYNAKGEFLKEYGK